MYENFYGLVEKPFQIVPNPDYLYMSPAHENALTYLEYGLMENVGFILLTGEVGAGKTTLVRHITEAFESEKEIAVIFNTNVTEDELICLVLQSFELGPGNGSKAVNLEILHQFFIKNYAENKHVLLVIDEAQNLSDQALEEVRMLSNLQSDDQNLLQVMLVGQPELREKLQHPRHRPFAQRIAVNYYLSGLTDMETRSYIAHRLEKAGGKSDIFDQEAIEMIYHASGGIPRSINLLCDAALVYGFGYDLKTINGEVLRQVIKDKDGMGMPTGALNTGKALPESPDKETLEAFTDRLLGIENNVRDLRDQLESVAAGMPEGLEGRITKLEKYTESEMKNLFLLERDRNARLLEAYSRLKLRYEKLLKVMKSNSH